jgi:predicted deoxyguanosinetriphosphate triphosphohydrolase
MSEPAQNLETLRQNLLKGFEGLKDINGRSSDPRSLFEREYDRVVFSDYFRVLASKTQVVPLSECDSTHSRLTHSLEVARVGRSLGQFLVKELDPERKTDLQYLPDVIATACLLHDIGNPPFGHAGEDAIKGFFIEFFDAKDNTSYEYNRCQKLPVKLYLEPKQYKDFTFFDGNANGFRIITRLAGKENDGYKLSPITLAAYTKYPFHSGGFPGNDEKAKFGYFRAEEKEGSFNELSKLFLEKKRHPLAYLVEAADDICNRVIDLEDAVKNGHISFNDKQFSVLWDAFTAMMKPDKATNEKIQNAEQALQNYSPNKPIRPQELKALETLRAEAIRFFVECAFKNYMSPSSLPKILNGDCVTLWDEVIANYDKNESPKPEIQTIWAQLSENLKHKISSLADFEKHIKTVYLEDNLYCHTRKADIEISGYKVIRFILKLMLNALCELKNEKEFKDCSTKTRHLIRHLGVSEDNYSTIKAKEDYELCLLVTDFITKCSDRELLSHYHNWMGIDI